MDKKIQCPYCFEKFSILIDLEDGDFQEMIYDCEVCCHPIELKIMYSSLSQKVSVEAHKSTGFN